jgi:hypothetical protein
MNANHIHPTLEDMPQFMVSEAGSLSYSIAAIYDFTDVSHFRVISMADPKLTHTWLSWQ